MMDAGKGVGERGVLEKEGKLGWLRLDGPPRCPKNPW